MEIANYNKDQVFISFRGKDQRYSFLTHLKAKLKLAKVNVFTDEDAIGKPLSHLLEQIRNSRIVIVLFTENYPESYWCLDELVEVAECIERKQLHDVIPVFYKVKATSVEEQSGEFGEKFMDVQKSLLVEAGEEAEKKEKANSRIEGWKNALKVVSGWIGLGYVEKTSEDEFAKKIADRVNEILDQIAAAEGRSVIAPQPTKAQAANTTVVNQYVNQLTINNHFHFSTTLDALNLARQYYEGYNWTQNLKPSPNFTSYVENLTEPNVPQEGPHPAYGRTMSYDDNIKQSYPLHLDTSLVPEEDKGKSSLDNVDLGNSKNGGISLDNVDRGNSKNGGSSLDNVDLGNSKNGGSSLDNVDLGNSKNGGSSLDNVDLGNSKNGGSSLDNVDLGNSKNGGSSLDNNDPGNFKNGASSLDNNDLGNFKNGGSSLDNVNPGNSKNGGNSLDNIDPGNSKNGGTSCVSALSYYLKRCFCLASGAENELEDLRNEPSIASNN